MREGGLHQSVMLCGRGLRTTHMHRPITTYFPGAKLGVFSSRFEGDYERYPKEGYRISSRSFWTRSIFKDRRGDKEDSQNKARSLGRDYGGFDYGDDWDAWK